MSLRYGTLVTRFNPDIEEKSCINGTCVGKLVSVVSEEHILVKWLDWCKQHEMESKVYEWRETPELWEIGQIN